MVGPSSLKGHGLLGIEQLLADGLKRSGITATVNAKLAINGKLRRSRESGSYFLSIQIVDEYDEIQVDFDFGVPIGSDDLGRIAGISFDVSEIDGGEVGKRESVLFAEIQSPGPAIKKNLTIPTTNSRFGLEVLVRSIPRKPYAKAELAFVPIAFGEEYIVRLHNDSAQEIAAELFVDGLSCVHFSKPKISSYFIIGPHSHLDLKGWITTRKKAKAFRVTPAEDSLAAKLGRYEQIGIITANFRFCWQEGDEVPSAEPAKNNSSIVYRPVGTDIKDISGRRFEIYKLHPTRLTSSGRAGTTFGSDINVDFSGVSRVIGKVQSSVTLRYDRPASK
ncbi:hypothetical protein OAH18_00410 [bacterium]|nr:hypothetical protein [bacterium]